MINICVSVGIVEGFSVIMIWIEFCYFVVLLKIGKVIMWS